MRWANNVNNLTGGSTSQAMELTQRRNSWRAITNATGSRDQIDGYGYGDDRLMVTVQFSKKHNEAFQCHEKPHGLRQEMFLPVKKLTHWQSHVFCVNGRYFLVSNVDRRP